MANTYTLIANSTVGSGGSATIEFTSIPSTYTDLLVKISARSNRADWQDIVKFNFNSNTSNLKWAEIMGYSTTIENNTSTSFMGAGRISANTTTSNTFGNTEIYIPNYNLSNNKGSLGDSSGENNGSLGINSLAANLWSNTSAITSITLGLVDGTLFLQYSTATLYGIKSS